MKLEFQDSRLAAATTMLGSLLAGIVHGAAFGAANAAMLAMAGCAIFGLILFSLKGRAPAKQLLVVIGVFWIASYAVGLRWLLGGLVAPQALGWALGSMVFAAAIIALSCVNILVMWAAAVWLKAMRWNALYAAFICSTLLASDCLRDLLLPGFPWLSIGYTQVDSAFAALLPLIGMQGTGWVTALTALLIGALLASSGRGDLERGSVIGALVVIALGSTAARYALPAFTSDAAPVTVALLQTTMTTREKFTAGHLNRELTDIVEFARAQDAQLILTPETVLPTSLDALLLPQTRFLQSSVSDSRAVIIGTFSRDSSGNTYNSAVLMQTPPGKVGVKRSTYIKRHLAPLGEYAPAGFRWLGSLLGMPVSDLVASQDTRVNFHLPGLTIIPSVCGLDLAYGDDLRDTSSGPRMLVNLSNPIFFSAQIARAQYIAIARTRALEQQLPVLIAANYAPTAVISGDGIVSQLLPAGKPGFLRATVLPRIGTTPYSRFGGWFSNVILILSACGAAVLLLQWLRLRWTNRTSWNTSTAV